ncbi:hypothetical protein F5B17DRAFT_430576 [Nemania serpens]|nr:hypothetical protein F5B17DRAFT_430576 [Nemania serpens]
MPSSSEKPNTPTRAPLNATNSWIISQARELIDYNEYDAILQWLEDVPDDADEFLQWNSGNDTGKSSDYPDEASSVRDHPAGEIEDYDQDRVVFSQKSIIERLEDAAAALEGRLYEGDDDTESYASGSFAATSSHVSPSSTSDWDSGSADYQPLSSDSGVSDHQSLAPDSLEGEPLLEIRQKTKLGSEVGSEGTVIRRPFLSSSRNTAFNSMAALLSLPSSNTNSPLQERTNSDFVPGNESQNRAAITHAGSRSKVLSSLSKLFTSTKFRLLKSPLFTGAQPASAEARNGKSKSKLNTKSESEPEPKSERNRLKKHAKTYKTYEHPPAYPEIERCPSPMPRVRPHPHHLPYPSTLAPTPRILTSLPPRPITSFAPTGIFRAIPTNTPGLRALNNTTTTTPHAPSTPLLRFSTHGGTPAAAAATDIEREILCPTPQVSGRLFVPVPSRNQFRISPFAALGVQGEIPIPVVSVQGVQGFRGG